MWIDSHCHLTFQGLLETVDAVIERAEAAGVHTLVGIGTKPTDHAGVLLLARKYPQIWGVLGFHPNHSHEVEESDWLILRQRLKHEPRLLAIGECGVDYHYSEPSKNIQIPVFKRQLDLATELNKPVVLHIRDAHADGQAVMREYPHLRFVVHCFTGTPDECQQWLDMGAMIGITGIVTYKNAGSLREAALKVPADRLLVETDAPYLSPEPVRKIKTNEPSFVAYTGKFLAALRGVDEAVLAQQTTDNARRFFSLPDTQPSSR